MANEAQRNPCLSSVSFTGVLQTGQTSISISFGLTSKGTSRPRAQPNECSRQSLQRDNGTGRRNTLKGTLILEVIRGAKITNNGCDVEMLTVQRVVHLAHVVVGDFSAERIQRATQVRVAIEGGITHHRHGLIGWRKWRRSSPRTTKPIAAISPSVELPATTSTCFSCKAR